MADPFWIEKLTVLFDGDRVYDFVPRNDQSLDEKLNAVARFAVYCGILVALWKRDLVFLGIVAIPILVLTMLARDAWGGEDAPRGAASSTSNDPLSPHPTRFPTIENPFMNLSPLDVGNDREPPRPADVNDPKVRAAMLKAFHADMPPAEDDMYQRKQGELIFYHNNVASPPDTIGFARWLFPDAQRKTTKEQGSNLGPLLRDPRTGKLQSPTLSSESK